MASTRRESVTPLRFVTLSLRFSTAPYNFIRFFLPQLLTKSRFCPTAKTQDIVTKKHKIRNILCFLAVVAFSYNKDGSPCWARTNDIMINSHALYRLS